MLPTEIEQVTPSWLSQVLNARVDTATVQDAHYGTTGRAVMALEGANSLPRRVFIKLPPNSAAQREFVVSNGMGKREAKFYRALSAEVPIRVPGCFHADWDDGGGEYIMVLEHLEDAQCTFRNVGSAYSKRYLECWLDRFAQLHAAYWDSPRFAGDLGWVQPPVQHAIAPVLVGQALEKHADEMPSVFSDMAQLYLDHTDRVHALWLEGTPTLIHGDVHDGNTFMDNEEPGLLDWALVARAPGMRDVGYFLAGTLAADDQAGWYPQLLAFYRQRLEAHGAAPPSIEELVLQYRRHAAYIWLSATVTLVMGDAWQPVAYVQSSLRRIHTALEVLDSVGALSE